MIEGVKRCYGLEYWNDLGIVKYEGCYYNGKKQGYGLLYDRRGDIEHEGLFKDDCNFDTDSTLNWNDNSDMIIDSYIESLIIDDDFNPDISCLSLTSPLISLKRIEIGCSSFKKVNEFVINGLNELEIVKIGRRCFKLDANTRKESKCLIRSCDQLKEVDIGGDSFYWYTELELKNLLSLQSIHLSDNVFAWFHSAVLESENNE